jgi:hypothetical protein
MGSSHSVLLSFFQFYMENDLRKNKIIVVPTTVFLDISTKIEVLALNLGCSNLFCMISSLNC